MRRFGGPRTPSSGGETTRGVSTRHPLKTSAARWTRPLTVTMKSLRRARVRRARSRGSEIVVGDRSRAHVAQHRQVVRVRARPTRPRDSLRQRESFMLEPARIGADADFIHPWVWPPRSISMKRALVFTATLSLLSACGDDNKDGTTASGDPTIGTVGTESPSQRRRRVCFTVLALQSRSNGSYQKRVSNKTSYWSDALSSSVQ